MNWKSLSAIVIIAAVGAFVWFVVERSANSEFNEPETARRICRPLCRRKHLR